ncbi:plasma membrane ATPase 1-like [Dorcoceras hygrometricum]|uniref:Plasma membrane ATPase 1-like n=1 Tax=Dorcoceras hygrometricum TaxID=472368 RepID=A0A2Z7CMS3_9LAMI|nr:plasma membrane ATPase 1-like [Dorcoceras hygrometricum]
MRIRPPELETSICDAKYHVSLSTRSVLGKWVYLVTLAISLFDLQDVCIAIGSIATLDLPMVVDLIGIYGLKGPYCMLTTTNWFLQALSVIPRGSWGDVSRRSYNDPMGKSGIVIPEQQWFHGDRDEPNVHTLDPGPLGRSKFITSLLNVDLEALIITLDYTTLTLASKCAAPSSHKSRRLHAAAASLAGICSGQYFEDNPSALISSGLLVQADEGVSLPVVDLIDVIYRRLP